LLIFSGFVILLIDFLRIISLNPKSAEDKSLIKNDKKKK
jgi:hypothetical protein